MVLLFLWNVILSFLSLQSSGISSVYVWHCHSSHYCHKIPDRSKLREEGFIFGSWSLGTVHYSREGKDGVAQTGVAAMTQNSAVRQRAKPQWCTSAGEAGPKGLWPSKECHQLGARCWEACRKNSPSTHRICFPENHLIWYFDTNVILEAGDMPTQWLREHSGKGGGKT